MSNALGKATIPWLIAMNIGLAWASGALFTYVLSLHFMETSVPDSLEFLFDTWLVNDKDDLAGLLCGTVAGFIFLLLSAYQILKWKQTWQLPLPSLNSSVAALLWSTIWLSPIWAVTFWFFEIENSRLPGDDSWPAIACFCSIASFHAFLFATLLPYPVGRSSPSPDNQ